MKTAKPKRFYCGHCEQEVSRGTLYAHKRLYYNRMTREWSKTRVGYTGSDYHATGCHEESDEESQSDADDFDDGQYSPLHFESQDEGA